MVGITYSNTYEISIVNAAGKQKNDYAGHWGEKDISWALQNKLMWKYPDGSFHPDEQITQAHFLTSLVAVMGLKEKMPYSAVGNHWAKDAYEKASKAGWMTKDIKIDPNAKINRYEAGAWIANAWGHKHADPLRYTYLERLVHASWRFNKGFYLPNSNRPAYRNISYFLRTALPTDKFTRAEVAHSLKLIHTRRAQVAETYSYFVKLKNSIVIKDGKAYGQMPNFQVITSVKEFGGGHVHQAKYTSFKPGKSYVVTANGFIGFTGSFDASSVATYRISLPNLKVENQHFDEIEKDPILNNRNK